MFDKKDIIYAYTTKEAVEDGTLVTANNEVLKKAAIRIPVYITRHVWDRYVEVDPEFEQIHNPQFRLFNILILFASAALKCDGSMLQFKINSLIPHHWNWESNESKSSMHFSFREVILKAVISANDLDDPSPAIFIMAPYED